MGYEREEGEIFFLLLLLLTRMVLLGEVVCWAARLSALVRKGLVVVRVGGCWRRFEERRRARSTRAVEEGLASPKDRPLPEPRSRAGRGEILVVDGDGGLDLSENPEEGVCGRTWHLQEHLHQQDPLIGTPDTPDERALLRKMGLMMPAFTTNFFFWVFRKVKQSLFSLPGII